MLCFAAVVVVVVVGVSLTVVLLCCKLYETELVRPSDPIGTVRGRLRVLVCVRRIACRIMRLTIRQRNFETLYITQRIW